MAVFPAALHMSFDTSQMTKRGTVVQQEAPGTRSPPPTFTCMTMCPRLPACRINKSPSRAACAAAAAAAGQNNIPNVAACLVVDRLMSFAPESSSTKCKWSVKSDVTGKFASESSGDQALETTGGRSRGLSASGGDAVSHSETERADKQSRLTVGVSFALV